MNIQQYLPSSVFGKRIATIVVLIILVVTIPRLWSYIALKINAPHRITSQEADTIASKDTDGDGVYDWQESLWGTDINNVATFDNIPDAIYIAKKQETLNTTDAQSDNKTDTLSKQLFATINAIKASGTMTPEDSYKEIADSVAQYVTDSKDDNTRSITKSAITVLPDSSANKKAYITSLGNLSETFFGKNAAIGGETSILYYALVNEDPSHLPDLTPIIASYDALAKKLTTIKVPAAAAADHVLLVNTVYQISTSLTDMQSLFNDTVVGIRGIVEYNKSITDLDGIIGRLQTYASN